jgi:hypothetical protein
LTCKEAIRRSAALPEHLPHEAEKNPGRGQLLAPLSFSLCISPTKKDPHKSTGLSKQNHYQQLANHHFININ